MLFTHHSARRGFTSQRRISIAIVSSAFVFIALAAPRALADDPKTVVATVGDHKITEQDLDQKVKPQIDQLRAALAKRVDDLIRDKTFDLKRKTLESMADDWTRRRRPFPSPPHAAGPPRERDG